MLFIARKFALLLLCFTIVVHFVYAQKPPIPVPDFFDQVMYINERNELADLDKTGLSVDRNNKFNPFAVYGPGVKVFLKAEGCCARVSHVGKPEDRYIVRIESGIDPETTIELVKLEEKETYRRLVLTNTTIGNALRNNIAAEMITFPLNFKKVADGVYLVTTKEQLPQGEYIFTTKSMHNNSTINQNLKGQTVKGYCFSVGKNG